MQGTHADAPQQPKSSKTADNKKSGNIVSNTVVFLREVVKEAKKITWPPRSQVIQETTSVIVLVTLITVMVLGFDYALGNWVFGPIEHLAKITAPKAADDNGMFTPVAPPEDSGPRTRDEDVPPQEQPQQQAPIAPGTTPTGTTPAPGATPGTPVTTPSTTPAQTTTPPAPVGTVPAPTSAPAATPATTAPAPAAPATIPTPTAPPATPGASVPGATAPAKPAPATPTTPHP